MRLGELKMDKLLEILNDLHPEVDFEKETGLIDSKIFDSFDVVTIASEIIEAYDVDIDAEDMVPENFNSLEAIWDMIQRKQEEA